MRATRVQHAECNAKTWHKYAISCRKIAELLVTINISNVRTAVVPKSISYTLYSVLLAPCCSRSRAAGRRRRRPRPRSSGPECSCAHLSGIGAFRMAHLVHASSLAVWKLFPVQNERLCETLTSSPDIESL